MRTDKDVGPGVRSHGAGSVDRFPSPEDICNFEAIAKRLVGGDVQRLFGGAGDLVVAGVCLILVLAFAGFLYRNRIFLRA